MRKFYTLLAGFFLTLVLLQAKAQIQNELANFTFTVSGTTTAFTNTSNSPIGDTSLRRCLWTFGDGSSLFTNYSTNPIHTYPQPGGYQACLKLYRRVTPTTTNGDTLILLSSICKPVYIQSPDSCRASFEVPLTSTNPLSRYFIAQPWHNNQKRPERICWTFGDGSDTCINYDPNQSPPNAYAVFHQYSQPGTYSVCITILYQGGCEAHYCKTIQIAEPVTCSANFEVSQTPGTSPLAKTFTAIPSNSQNKKPLRVCWNFGDSRDTCINYTTDYPGPYAVTHNYTNAGNYNVCVKISYDGGCEAYKCQYVQVSSPDSCRASFEILSASSNQLGKYFVAQPWHNNQKRPERICWTFGDGSDTCINYDLTQPSPTAYAVFHLYSHPGTYVVCVKILYQGGCEAQSCKTLIIEEPVTCSVSIQVNQTGVSLLGKTFTAIPSNSQNKRPVRICWNFGDNRDTCINYSTAYPGPYSVFHNYTNPGYYNVCLKISYDGGCEAYKCQYVQVSSPDSCRAGFEILSVASNVRGKYFVAQPWHNNQKKPERICWTFGDGSDTCINYDPSQPPPNAYAVFHSYSQPGTYVVCVKILYQGGCEAGTCKNLIIDEPVTCGANFEVGPISTTSLGKIFTAIPANSQNKKPLKICWNFGDSRDTCITYATTYTGPYNVSHNYSAPGQYNVCVKITYDGGCEAYSCHVITVTVPVTCTANFETAPTTGSSALIRYFYAIPGHSTQNKPVYICWDFGDNKDTCIQYSSTYTGPYAVSHIYASPGSYNVCVRIVYEGGCEARNCKLIQITIPENCQADFERIPVTTSTPLTANFKALPWHENNKKPIRICWKFGDNRDTCIYYPENYTGTYTVTHTYNHQGIYEVCVRILYAGGCEAVKCKPIVVAQPETCKASIYQLTSSFTSLTRGLYVVGGSSANRRIERICWNFGDGSDTCIVPLNTTPLPMYSISHTYPGPGVYRACVKILFAGGCEAEACTEIVIRSANGICGGYFTDSLTTPRTITFRGFSIHSSGDNVLGYRWSFGDGTNATGQNAEHTYSQPGVYNVCLQIITERGCETHICKKVMSYGNATPVLQLTPNPVTTVLHAVFISTHTETVTIRIVNSSGNAVRTYTRNVTAGVNTWDFNLAELLPGIYSFIVQSPNQFVSGIFIKQ